MADELEDGGERPAAEATGAPQGDPDQADHDQAHPDQAHPDQADPDRGDAALAAPASVDEHRDELPADLDPSRYVGPYMFPNNNRRRISGLICGGVGVACVLLYVVRGDGVLVNRGIFLGGLLLLALACYHFVSGVTLRVNETDALVAATKSVGFSVGHASAQLSWRGLISHPTWRILLYSADEPPSKRALILVDGVAGTVGDRLIEDNPEDWSGFDR